LLKELGGSPLTPYEQALNKKYNRLQLCILNMSAVTRSYFIEPIFYRKVEVENN